MKANLGIYLFACCSATFSAAAQAPQPSAEFWQYMLEFADENGELMDPLEFAQLDKSQLNKMSEAKMSEAKQNNFSDASTEALSQSTTATQTRSSRNPPTSSSAEELSQ